MKALVYNGPGSKAWEEVPHPSLREDTDAIVRIDVTTICGSDLHTLKGDLGEFSATRPWALLKRWAPV
jgi:alcohol dehydrogenase